MHRTAHKAAGIIPAPTSRSASGSISRSDRWIGIPALAICLLLAQAVVAALANLATDCIVIWLDYSELWNLGHQVMLGVGEFFLLMDLFIAVRMVSRRIRVGFPVQVRDRADGPAPIVTVPAGALDSVPGQLQSAA